MTFWSTHITVFTILVLGAVHADAQEDTSSTVETGSAEEATVFEEPDSQQLTEAPQSVVRMYCNTTNGNRRVQIRASNASNRNITCTSRCYYRRSDGYNGVLRCTGTVGANANNQLFCYTESGRYTYRVTNPGSNNCP